MKRLTLMLTCLFISMGLAFAQSKQVTGTVVDENGDPVIGASVVVKGTTTGTVTNLDGRFTLTALSSAQTLVVRYLGMQDQEVAITENVLVTLHSASTGLDEVIVVAYGTTKRSSFTGSAATIKSDDIEKRKVSNVTKALDGMAPGVQVTSGGGQPGSGTSVYIRGLGSINAANTPLYVVDGIPYDGNISAISSNDIESITVLKDASAGALYGARGGNGVVMITTKKGKAGVTEVNFKANFGIASRALPRYETMKSKDFIEASFSAFYNRAIDDGFSPDNAGAVAIYEMSQGAQKIFGKDEMYNPYNYNAVDLIDPITGKIRSDARLLWEDDWLDEITRNDAWRQEYTIDLSGGAEKTQYFVSFGYLDHNGLLETTNFKRYSGRTNVESKPLDWFGLGLNSNFSHTAQNLLYTATSSATSNVWNSAQMMGPIFPVYLRDRNNDGKFILDEFGQKQFDYGASRPAGQQGDFNSIATLYNDLYNQKVDNLSARGHVDFGDTKEGWAKGLKLALLMGVDYYGYNFLQYYNPYFGNAANSSGRVSKNGVTVLSYTANQMLSYDVDIQDIHHIDAMVAHEYYDLEVDALGTEKAGFPFGGLTQPSAATTLTGGTGSINRYRIESYLGRVNYDFDDRYYFSASFRRDGSSRFEKDNRWGNFWSVGGNYRISQEDFMEATSSWLDNLAVRASYGVQGNDNVGTYYAWQAMYDLGWPNANEPGALVTDVENRRATWEKNANLNVGLDISFWDSRLQFGAEYFRRTTTDLLLFYPMPMSTGFEGYYKNSGSMLNSGLELTVTGKIIKTNDFEWNATLMVSTIKNKVLELTEDNKDITTGTRIIRKGEALHSWYLPKSAGVDPLTGDQLYVATRTIVVDGEEKEEDYITNSAVFANDSRYVAGDMFPDVYGSFSTELKYKGFDLSIATTYSLGGKMIDGVYQQMRSFYYPAQAKHVDLLRAWRKPGDITDIPRYDLGGSIGYHDGMLIDASYFSIKNVTLGYTLSSRIAKRVGLKALRVYVAADNLYMATSLTGTNPQYSIIGGTDFSYVPERLVSFGIDLKF